MYSLIMRVRSSNARSSAVFFRLFFAIVIHQFQSDSLHVFPDVGKDRHDDRDGFFVDSRLHAEMMPLGPAVGKWLFQAGRYPRRRHATTAAGWMFLVAQNVFALPPQ